MISLIDQIEIDYAGFNALKALATLEPSAFEPRYFGELVATRDRTRPDPYYNRVLGLSTENTDSLEAAIGWIASGAQPGQRIRIDVADTSDAKACLAALGFERTDEIVWLRCDPSEAVPTGAEHATRVLTSNDWPALRELLQCHSDIPDEIWYEKRSYLCTKSFRWFGVFADEQLVSAASLWHTSNAVVLGSAYTRAPWRGRGYQSLLLERRLAEAENPAYVDVAPGSTSYRNCVRAGFVEHERRTIWERDPAAS